jgi:endonuclease/exonuclease/phosphatase family metal-dependent hydrolase
MGPSQRMSAGTAILVDRRTAPLVVDNGILMEGRAQFIKLQAANNGTLTIVNVYAAQTSRNRALLWKTISKAELDSNNTIIGGDFNHQEETSCRGITSGRHMHRREAASWHHMTLQYGLSDAWCSDSFRKMSKKAYTFDNRRSGASSTVSKINKFMVSQDLDSRGGKIKSTISIKKFSNHSPLLISIWGKVTDTSNLARYFDTSLLEEAEGKATVLQAWARDTPTPSSVQGWAPWLEAAIGRVMSCNNRLTKTKKRLKGATIRTHTKKIQLTEAQLQGNLTNEGVKDILSDS